MRTTHRNYSFNQALALLRRTDTDASQTLESPGLRLATAPGPDREIVVGEADAAAWLTMSTRRMVLEAAAYGMTGNTAGSLAGLGLGIPREGEPWLLDSATGISDFLLLAADLGADRWALIVGRCNEGTVVVTPLQGVRAPSVAAVTPRYRAALRLEHQPGEWATASIDGVPGALLIGADQLPDFDGFGGEVGSILFARTGVQVGGNAPAVNVRFQDLTIITGD